MRARLVAIAAITAACGRYQFNPVGVDAAPAGDASEGTIDASIVPAALHRYPLAADFKDALGGPTLVSGGGALGVGGYRFAKNEGLSLAGEAIPVGAYTIDFTVNVELVAGYRKLIDFKNLALDDGFYIHDEKLAFVTDASVPTEYAGPPVFAAGVDTRVTLTHGADGNVVGYVNRKPQLEFSDTRASAVFSTAGRLAYFVVDDEVTRSGSNEATGGAIRELAIWATPLTREQVAALP